VSVYDDARSYLSRTLGGFDMSAFDDATIRRNIEAGFEGGWDAFKADYERFHAPERKDRGQAVLTPFQQYVKLRRMVHGQERDFRLKPHEEVLAVEVTDDVARVMIKVVSLDERSRADVIVATGTKFMTFKKFGDSAHMALMGRWKQRPVDVTVYWDDEPTVADQHRWGRLRTPERVESDGWQLGTCYRPGTAKSPMDGYVRRMEVSWEEAFADEVGSK